MSKANKILLAVIIALLVGIGYFVFRLYGEAVFSKNYYAVYLTSGDFYFGRLHFFPSVHLTEVRHLGRNPNFNPGGEADFYNLLKFSDAFWGPEDKLWFNPKNVVWAVKLKNDSQVVQLYGR